MKRILMLILAGLLLLTGCGGQEIKYRMEGRDWQIVTVQSTEDGKVIAVGETMREICPEAEVIGLTCKAENGKLTFTMGEQSWEGSYTRADSSGVEAAIYTVTLGEESGPAAVAATVRQDGSAEQTLVMQLGGWSLYFSAAEA